MGLIPISTVTDLDAFAGRGGRKCHGHPPSLLSCLNQENTLMSQRTRAALNRDICRRSLRGSTSSTELIFFYLFQDVDEYIGQTKDKICDTLVHFGRKGLNVAATAAVMAATKVMQTLDIFVFVLTWVGLWGYATGPPWCCLLFPC